MPIVVAPVVAVRTPCQFVRFQPEAFRQECIVGGRRLERARRFTQQADEAGAFAVGHDAFRILA
jgi:hypothetical protein